MRTLDEQNDPSSFSLPVRFVRDAKLLLRIATMIGAYFTLGVAIRRRYRRSERQGDPYWLDEPDSAPGSD